MLSESGVHLVKAVHNFKGSNNDELCFKKGDIITVTQVLDGGWWEGTFNDVTGWFPSNYVKEIKHDSIKSSKTLSHHDAPLSPKLENLKMYRGIVFKDIVDTENNHLNEIKNLINTYLNPLKEKDILTEDEYATLKNNIEEVCACNAAFVCALEDVQEKPPKDQKIGGVFMQKAPQIKKVNYSYCANHPKATAVVEKHKDELEKFMEEHGASSPGILTLTTGLSSPFRRLEKYPALLQELQRHTEESHIDRGDTHRAIFVYRDIAAACLNIRRQKENELQVMSGNIRGWEGEDIQTLGEIIHMGLVVFLPEDQEKKDRYLVAFPQNLVILSVSARISTFIYEGKLPLSGVTVKKLEPCESYQYAFEITGSMIQRIIIICPSQESLDQWLSVLQPNQVLSPKVVARASPSQRPPAHKSLPSSPVATVQQPSQSSPLQSQSPSGCTPVSDDRCALPQGTKITPAHRINNKVWSSWSLRPHPPSRPNLWANKEEVPLRRSNSRRKEKAPDEKNYEGDMKILQVIEAYCTIAKSRYTVNSAILDVPPLLITEEEKVATDEFDVDAAINEKNLLDTVYLLKDQIQELKSETSSLFKYLDEEKKARRKLELMLQKHMLGNCEAAVTAYFDD